MKAIKKKFCLALLTALLVLSVFAGLITVTAAQGTGLSIQFGIDSYYYLDGRNMTVSGQVLNGESGENVTLTISNATGVIQTNNTVTNADGTFSLSLPVPSPGAYNIMATSQGVTSGLLDFVVIGPNDIYEIQAEFTSEVKAVPLSSDLGGDIISDLNTTGMVGGNVTIDGTKYYFLVDKAGGKYSIAYVDDDEKINFTTAETNGMSPIANLGVGSKVKLGNMSLKIIYIDPLGSELILASPVDPLFSGEDVSKEITALALNASGSPVSGETITREIIKDDGTVHQSSTSMGDTNDYGLVTTQISLPDTSGIYHIIFNNIGHISFSVENYEMRGYVLSSELEPQHTFAAGDSMIFAAVLSDASTDQPISATEASVWAIVRGPGGFSANLSLSYDADIGMWNRFYTTLPSYIGDYKVVYVATILASGEQQKAFTGFEIRGYDLFLKPVSPERPELEGFSPGEDGYIFVAGADLSSGDMADIDGLTGNANKTNFTLEILSGNGTDVTGTSWGVMNLSEFFAELPVPPWIQDEIKRHAGEGACVINFTAPGETGVYKVTVTVNLSGTIEEARTSIGVQKIFVHGEPVTSDGMFSPVVSRRENVTLRIMAFDPKSGTELPASNITDAGLIEVFSEGAGDIVTEYMENPTFDNGEDYDTLKFYVNDTELGFHHVKFWVNATVGGSSTMAVGEGWFETRQFFIWANPESEGGVFKAFGSDSQINLTVYVKDGSFNPVERATVSIDEIRYGKNWEKISFDSSSSTSGSTDANGTCTLSVTPSSSLKSGWYDVRIKVSAQDNAGDYITDYGRGWFEVRNFIFDVYPENWDVQAGQQINFTVRVMDATNMSASMNARVTLKKIIYMGSWENPQPPKLVAEPSGVYKDITTNITTSETITYSDGVTMSGGYEFVFEAASGDNTEERRTWIECRPFIAWAYPAGDNWDRRYGIGENMSIIVAAYDGWGGAAHNISATETNITKIMKEGWRMDRPYMTQVDIASNITVTHEGGNNTVNITLNLTDWTQGAYFATIKVVNASDSDVEVYTNFWFQVELASVSIPEFYHIGIPEGNVYTNKVSFNVTKQSNQVFEGDPQWPSYNYSVASNSYVGHHIIFIKDCWRMGEDNVECHRLSADQYPEPFWALVNRTSPQTLYINYTDANFSHANTTSISGRRHVQ